MNITKSKIIFLLILLAISYLVVKWNVSAKQIRALCENTKQQQEISGITDSLKNSWLLRYSDRKSKNKNIIHVHSPSSFGRYTCFIEYKDGKVIKTEYLHLD